MFHFLERPFQPEMAGLRLPKQLAIGNGAEMRPDAIVVAARSKSTGRLENKPNAIAAFEMRFLSPCHDLWDLTHQLYSPGKASLGHGARQRFEPHRSSGVFPPGL